MTKETTRRTWYGTIISIVVVLAMAVITLLPAVTEAAPGPSLRLSRAAAAPGDQVAVTGYRFHPRETVTVQASFTVANVTKVIQVTTTEERGRTWHATLTVPDGAAPGDTSVTATDQHGDRASQTLTVLPLVVVQAGHTMPVLSLGTMHRLVVRGTGFQAGEVVRLTAVFPLTSGRSSKVTRTIRADTQGQFGDILLTLPRNVGEGTANIAVVGLVSQRRAMVDAAVGQAAPARVVHPSISLSASSYGPGATLIVRGTGFTPRQAVQVALLVPPGNQLAPGTSRITVTTDQNGAFSTNLALPAGLQPGAYTVLAADVASGHGTTASLRVVLSAAISVHPSAANPGQIVTIKGSGFSANTRIDLTASIPLYGGGQRAVALHAQTGPRGNFAVSLQLPANTASQPITLSAQGPHSKATTSLTVNHINAGVSVPSGAVTPGSALTVAGSGYLPNDTVAVSVTVSLTNGAKSTLTKTAHADGSGRFTTSISIPANAVPGSYSLVARSVSSGRAPTTTLVVGRVASSLSVSPQQTMPGKTVTINGHGFSANVSITVTATIPLFGGGSRTVSVTAYTGPRGNFSTQLSVPTNAASQPFTVTASGPQGHATAQAVVGKLTPGVSVSTSTIRPGMALTVDGAGYLAGASITVTAHISTGSGTTVTLTASARANGAGQFSTTLRIPSNAVPGSYVVLAKSVTSGRFVSTHFSVVRAPVTLAVSPTAALPGQTLDVAGGGYRPGVTVTVSANFPLYGGGSHVVMQSVKTDASGHFTVHLAVPANAGAQQVVVSAHGPVRQQTAVLTVRRLSTAVSVAGAVVPGHGIAVSGSGYLPGDRIAVSVAVRLTNGTTTTITSTVTAGGNGHFTATLHVPANVVGGTYTLIAKSTATGRAPTAHLVVSRLVPSIVAVPATVVPGAAIVVNGFGFAAGQHVDVMLAGKTVGSATTDGAGKFTVHLTVPSGLATGPYTLVAQAASGRKANLNLSVQRMISTHFYFASIYTGRGYHEYLAFLNPTGTRARVTITYQLTTGQKRVKSIEVNANSRRTEDVNADLGVHVSAGAVVSSDVAIVVSRAVYHGNDAAIVPPATSPSTRWYFANGHTGHGYREYLAIENPNSGPVQVAVHFLPTHHRAFTIYRMVKATSRTTVKVNSFVARDAVGVTVTSNGPVVVNRSIFIHHQMTSQIGVAAPKARWYFAAGPRAASSRQWIGAINPNGQPSYVTLHAYNPAGQEVGTVHQWLKPYARVGYLINHIAHTSAAAVVLTASRPLVAEQMTYIGSHHAFTDTFGVSAPAKSWMFAAVNTLNTGTQEDVLTMFNPNLAVVPVVVQFMTTNGKIIQRTYTISPLSQRRVDVGSVAPNQELGVVVTSNLPVVALNRSYINHRLGAMTSNGIYH